MSNERVTQRERRPLSAKQQAEQARIKAERAISISAQLQRNQAVRATAQQ